VDENLKINTGTLVSNLAGQRPLITFTIKKWKNNLEVILNFRRSVTMETKAISEKFSKHDRVLCGVLYVARATWFQQLKQKMKWYYVYSAAWPSSLRSLLFAAPVITYKNCRHRSWNQITDATVLWLNRRYKRRKNYQVKLDHCRELNWAMIRCFEKEFLKLLVCFQKNWTLLNPLINSKFSQDSGHLWTIRGLSEHSKSDVSETKHAIF
jgi:hypothetical protein